ncbi:type II toxin-antitoxin system HicB family antitoxin [Salmonella enterica subsp. enterica serovar Poona]|nr:type II toxin-antitoxin system HicB family antitoxin [Salmonella enterica subsp. enterica serovar Poona]HEB6949290.1 type II toxin-antitoxin system HicB family antitoxin [Salmonella enterica subsp. enterica serovar Hvittingfoss]
MNKSNILVTDGHPAAVNYEAEISVFRGRFLDVTGYCDFIADSLAGLKEEGQVSLADYIDSCEEEGGIPFR